MSTGYISIDGKNSQLPVVRGRWTKKWMDEKKRA
jgi:hypothetical protein